MPGKIFGIGLPKTGTTSIHKAMTILGFTSQHYFGDARTIEQLRLADYDLDVLRRLEFACDLPIPLIYRQLEDVYPGSKYILTERDIDSWLASQIRATRKRSTPNLGSPRSFLRALAYVATSTTRVGTVAFIEIILHRSTISFLAHASSSCCASTSPRDRDGPRFADSWIARNRVCRSRTQTRV